MALVAYGSSDSDSDFEEDDHPEEIPTITCSSSSAHTAGNTNDNVETSKIEPSSSSLTFNLPAPKKAPASSFNRSLLVEEEDDEFLHKKSIAAEKPPPPPSIIAKKSAGGKVKIMLPALSSFGEHKAKEKPVVGAELPSARPTGLIGMLPKPKSETNAFGMAGGSGAKRSAALVPDSITRPKIIVKPIVKASIPSKPDPTSILPKSDSENSDDEDFFSLNTDVDLPEVSASEISAMVASKSAQMNMAAKKRQQQFQSQDPSEPIQHHQSDEAPTLSLATDCPSSSSSSAIDQQAMQALCGSRSRRGQEPINIIDISGDQVMPDRDEWMRTQLTASTEYQPRGLVDQEPGAGTKRKHQITYLAHQAKANEAELQAMWAANRHTKRQTQNKYGF